MKKEKKKGLDKQVYIYSVSSNAFFNDTEHAIHKVLIEEKDFKEQLKKLYNEKYKDILKETNERITTLNECLTEQLNKNEDKRQLREESLHNKNKVGIFDSVLTRTLKDEKDDSNETDDIIIVRTYHYDILKDLIHKGFTSPSGEEYIYFTSSAGGIRDKKSMWIKKSKWDKHKDALTNGLNRGKINNTKVGEDKEGNPLYGMVTNKWASYLAMTATASIPFDDFNIDEVIVCDDLTMDVTGKVDFMDKDYTITPQVTRSLPMDVNDGVGLYQSDNDDDKNFQFRSVWQKGLLSPYNLHKHAEKCGNYKVKDIYGDYHDIRNVKIVLTKSQFKAWKFWNSWEEFKQDFRDNKCVAAKLNEEGDKDSFGDSYLNYQYLQTLTDVSDSELEALTKQTVTDINLMGNDQDTMLKMLGADEGKEKLNPFQQSLLTYPELLNDKYSRDIVMKKRRSMIKKAKGAKLSVPAKYTYILPDLYQYCEWLFTGEPTPLLGKDEVFCDLYPSGKTCVNRSPHLYREHLIKQNTIDDDKKEWFKTNAVYIGTSFAPKLLMCDFDGDKISIHEPDSNFVQIAERNMLNDNIVPLYYDEPTANPQPVTDENIYDCLINSYKINIGSKSNEISRFWNGDTSNLDVVKWLVYENNMMIDYAKNLWLPTRPPKVTKIIKENISGKVPKFFIWAKGKKVSQVAKTNKSTVNRIRKFIPTNNIDNQDVNGEFNWRMLTTNPDPKKKINKNNLIINRYTQLDQKKNMFMKNMDDGTKKGELYVYKMIREELLHINKDPFKVADVLVKHLYEDTDSAFKATLWECFGKELLHNLKHNTKNTKQCVDCHTRIKNVTNKERCEECAGTHKKEYDKDYRKSKLNAS
ncbi:hypothetical protein [Halobacillus amylolyticus]|uniref:Uncharacterized protein n=1 Tax=Halobacillus amylolyticus TaxID=2932259 RepID=A0ABY4HC99_9BACI|nr:hypothetical protein [Halobacillus amylolyticus]UOR12181.1 hypothetical protein MUO15_01185 [Halobacillus amylolyticus]